MAKARYRPAPQMVTCQVCHGTGARPGALQSLSYSKSPDDGARLLRAGTCQECRGAGRVVKIITERT